jgi:hypothetical protein
MFNIEIRNSQVYATAKTQLNGCHSRAADVAIKIIFA